MAARQANSPVKPLKVLMTTDAVGGVWQYCVDLLTRLADVDIEVLIASLGPRPSPEQKRQIGAIPGISLVESDFALEWMQDAWNDVEASGKWLLELADDFEPDIVHFNGYAHANLDWRKPVIITAHSCVFSWWRAVHACIPGPEWAEYYRRVKSGLKRADVIIAPSHYMANALVLEYGIEREKVRVIYNFGQQRFSRCQYKQPFILAAGRMWDRAKNLDLLDRIAPGLNWELRVAGSDRMPDNSAGELTSVRLQGALSHSELLAQMYQASIFAHPALYEPFGLAVLEAAHARCCLVLSDIPSLRELWEGAAVFIDPHDPRAWTSELNGLIRDAARRESLGLRACAHASRYNPEQAISQYQSLYEALAGSARTLTNKDAAA